MRIEQLYPVPDRRLAATLDRYPNAEDVPLGAGGAGQPGRLAVPRAGRCPEKLPELVGIKRISRRAMAAPSSGSSKVHEVEQQEIIDEAFS